MYELPTLPLSGIEQLSWSPDGKYIAYACRKVTGKEYAFSTDTDIYLYDVEKGTCEDLTDGMNGYDTDPVFSPDGKYIAWISMERAGFEADKQRLFIIDVATRVKKELSVDYKYNVTNPVWKSTSDGIYFCSLVNALQGIFVSDLTGNITRITPDDCWYDFEGVIELQDKLLTCNHSMSRPNEIVEISLADGSFKQITHENDDILAQLKQETYEQRWITTTDGKKMHTWVVFPPDFDPAKQYPAMLFCTGGPQGTLSQGWSTRWSYKLMAANGYIEVLPNRRGTTAFGQEWCDQISGDYPGQNMKDYMAAAKNIKAEPYVGKIGASGASYGGYSIYNLAGTHEGFFDAFLSHAGIFNQEQMYMMTEELWFPTWDNGGAPWDNNPVAKRHYAESPHKKVTKWDTPIMVTHGEMDYRVPVEQGMAAFNAAQMMGVPSRMLLFPEENHWILRPQNAVHWQRSFFDWFDKWLK
jgi:dipeptidyl aminopeptidase/acylaminoacyl peptidase